jgi:hypothetical protein
LFVSHDGAQETPTACVLCAGTSDLPVAEEAAVTLGEHSCCFKALRALVRALVVLGKLTEFADA